MRTVLVLAPNSFDRFLGTSAESQFQLLSRSGHLASLPNMWKLARNPNAVLDRGAKKTNPMAGYYLESFLKLHGFDAQCVFDWHTDEAFEAALRTDPVAICFSTTYVTDLKLLAKSIDAIRLLVGDDIPLIVGGPYIWKQKYELARSREVVKLRSRRDALRTYGVEAERDSLFAPDAPPALRRAIYIAAEFGEHTLLRVLREIEQGNRRPTDLSHVPNLLLPVGESEWSATEAAEEPVDLDKFFTRWDLVESMPDWAVPLRTSVGCPFKCRYCDFIQLHPSVRQRSMSSIEEEVRLAQARGAKFFNFVDDNIFLSKSRIGELTGRILSSKLNIMWGGFFRVDRVDEGNIADLQRSGCTFGMCGIESGDREQLRRMRKGCRETQAHRGIELCADAGIDLVLTFIIGYPGETKESIDNTLEFVNTLKTDARGMLKYQVYPFYVLPATAVDEPEMREDYKLFGRYEHWSHGTMTSDDARNVWAPYFFKKSRMSYEYYARESVLPSGERSVICEARRNLTIAFLDNADDDTVQARFEGFWRVLTNAKTGAAPPAWTDWLAPREQQPGRRDSLGAFAAAPNS